MRGLPEGLTHFSQCGMTSEMLTCLSFLQTRWILPHGLKRQTISMPIIISLTVMQMIPTSERPEGTSYLTCWKFHLFLLPFAFCWIHNAQRKTSIINVLSCFYAVYGGASVVWRHSCLYYVKWAVFLSFMQPRWILPHGLKRLAIPLAIISLTVMQMRIPTSETQ